MLGGLWLYQADFKWSAILLFLTAVFVWFEAVRGWCLMRACGVKTKW